ncbi:MAG: LemA family protein [Prevotella sp.]|jgi:LemA protein|nr:LemA family protein [Prevotella sp.]
MSKKTWIIIAVVAVLFFWVKGAYNGLVEQDENVSLAWSKVETQYQRRNDLIMNMVKIAERYAKQEKGTLTAVIEARSKATSIQLSSDDLTEENMAKFQEAQSQLSGSLSRLMAVSENYPELKANENYTKIMDQLEGTENRIAEARNQFNDTVKPYNLAVRKFPNTIFAGIFGFKTKAEFKSEAGAEKGVNVGDAMDSLDKE